MECIALRILVKNTFPSPPRDFGVFLRKVLLLQDFKVRGKFITNFIDVRRYRVLINF
jgi:hypothetical protein